MFSLLTFMEKIFTTEAAQTLTSGAYLMISEGISERFVFKQLKQKSSPPLECFPLLVDYKWNQQHVF